MSDSHAGSSQYDDELLMAAGEDDMVRMLLGRYDVPAYVRRGLRVEAAIRDFFSHAEQCYRELLEPVIASARALARQISSLDALRQHFPDPGQHQLVLDLYEVFVPDARWRDGQPQKWPAQAAAQQLTAAIVRFNRRWRARVAELNYDEVNREIEAYNRYYLIEKECALRSRKLAARGFRPLTRIDEAAVLARFPLLEPGARLPR